MDGTWLGISISQCLQMGFTGRKQGKHYYEKSARAPRDAVVLCNCGDREGLETLDELRSLSIIGY